MKQVAGSRWARFCAGGLLCGRGMLVFVLGAAGGPSSASAELLAGWDVNGLAGTNNNVAAAHLATHVTSGVLDRGPGLQPDAGTNSILSSSWTMPASSTVADAVASNDYHGFSVTAEPGYHLTVTGIAWRAQRSASGPTNFTLRSSVYGFAADLVTWNVGGGISAVNLSNELNVMGGTALEFRVYGWRTGAEAGTGAFQDGGDFGSAGIDLALFGSVSTNEPPSEAIIVQPSGDLLISTPIGASSNILLQALAGSVLVQAAVTSATGHVTIRAQNSVIQSDDILTGGDGTILMEASTGGVMMADGTSATTGGGDVRVGAGQDVAMGLLNAGLGNVSVNAGRNITDNNLASNNVVAGGFRLVTTNGSVATGANRLETHVATLAARVGGNLYVDQANAVVVGAVTSVVVQRVNTNSTLTTVTDPALAGLGTRGSALLASQGSLVVSNALEAGTSVRLHAVLGDLALNAVVWSTNGTVSLLAQNSVIQNTGGSIYVLGAGRNADVEAYGGSVSMAAGTSAMTAGGHIRVAAANDVALGLLNAGAGNVSINAGQSMTDNNGSSFNVVGSGLLAQAGVAVGTSGDPIETGVGIVCSQPYASSFFIHQPGTVADSVSQVSVSRVQANGSGVTITDFNACFCSIDVLGTNGGAIANYDLVPSLLDGTDFGPVDLVTDRVTRVYGITNSGSARLTISSISTNGVGVPDFTVISFPATVPAGSRSNLVIRFGPSALGVRTADVVIAHNDTTKTAYRFGLRGTGAILDDDHDGLPNWWEAANGLQAGISNALTANADGDPMTDWEEYVADLNPQSSNAFLPVVTLTNPAPGAMSLVVDPTSTGRIYHVRVTTNLLDTPQQWTVIPPEKTGTGSAVTFIVTNDASERSYRTGVRLP
jgi:hypothetical protein